MWPKLELILFFFDGSVYKMYIHPTFVCKGVLMVSGNGLGCPYPVRTILPFLILSVPGG